MPSPRWFPRALCTAALVVACGPPALPDPRAAAAAYARAAARGDAVAVRGLLTEESRRALGRDRIWRIVTENRAEAAADAPGFASPRATVRAAAEIRYADGEPAIVELDGGRYRISSALGLPSAPRTPVAALGGLRAALSRRSYDALVRLLSTSTAGSVEADLRGLVAGLEHPETLDVRVHGDTAEADVPGGHRVVLKREAGVWRVHDFD